ncbi:MAG: HD domain-containing protein [Eubacterium sp.]|nr:HD domain-containing protein [Eubacterium sp.]
MERQFTNMRDLTRVYAEAMNLLRPETGNLHQRVAYIAYNIAKEMGFEGIDLEEILFTSFLYDVGIVLMPEKKEDEERYYFKDLAGSGLGILGDVKILRYATNVLRVADPESEVDFADEKYKSFAEIIDLADRIAFMLDTKDAALNQVEEISYSVQDMAGDVIGDDVVEAYLRFSEKEYVWMELLHQPEIILNSISDDRTVTLDAAITFAKFMARIIDFRSQYTAMHSSGVAATAVRLAEIMGMSQDECKKMMIAGYLHDIGKLKVPRSILEKSEKLTDSEFNIVKEYAYYTHLLLKDIEGFEDISQWAALHHEKLNGFGYPFRLKKDQIPMGARILALADTFSAVAEIRPYRQGLSKEEVIKILLENVERGAMFGYLVEMLITNYDEIQDIRDTHVSREGARYYASVVDAD